jgi:hypothetical protein
MLARLLLPQNFLPNQLLLQISLQRELNFSICNRVRAALNRVDLTYQSFNASLDLPKMMLMPGLESRF